MIKVNRFLKEWNAVVEALVQGYQTILIRKYGTNMKKFLMYPTTGYLVHDDFLKSFQGKYHEFVTKNSAPEIKEDQIKIKYFTKVEKIIQYNDSNNLDKYSIWTQEHINNYLNNDPAIIWVMRVYKLKKHLTTESAMGIRYSKTNHTLKTNELKPIIDDKKFLKIKEKLEVTNP